jgi:hypothetical protein
MVCGILKVLGNVAAEEVIKRLQFVSPLNAERQMRKGRKR